MNGRTILGIVVPVALGLVVSILKLDPAGAQNGNKNNQSTGFPGPSAEGFLLPNGWRVTPVGRQVELTDLPLNILTSPDGSHAFVATSGYNAHELTVIELATGKKVSVESVKQSWFGLAADFEHNKLWWSAGGDSTLHQFGWIDGQLKPQDSPLPKPDKEADKVAERTFGFRTGLCRDSKTGDLYSLTIAPKGGNKSFAW